MKIQQKISIAVLAVVTTGLFLVVTFHKQATSGENNIGWQLKPPPSAAGYGAPPLEMKPSDTSPASDEVKDKTKSLTGNKTESPSKEKDNGHDAPSGATWTINPPPSAAGGYGALPLHIKGGKNTPADQIDPQEPAPSKEKPGRSLPTWTIEPPPSAAGYGK